MSLSSQVLAHILEEKWVSFLAGEQVPGAALGCMQDATADVETCEVLKAGLPVAGLLWLWKTRQDQIPLLERGSIGNLEHLLHVRSSAGLRVSLFENMKAISFPKLLKLFPCTAE